MDAWDTKLDNGMNVSENRLYEAMIKIGLDPQPQYKISQMTVDFAFPNEMLVIEVNGPYHESEEQKIIDKKRYYVLRELGWKRKTFRADTCYENAIDIAHIIEKKLDKTKNYGSYSKRKKFKHINVSESGHPFYWWFIISLLFVLPLLIFLPLKYVLLVYFGFVILFFVEDMTQNKFVNIFLSINYILWAIFFIFISFINHWTKGESIMLIVIGLILFLLVYPRIRKLFLKSLGSQKNDEYLKEKKRKKYLGNKKKSEDKKNRKKRNIKYLMLSLIILILIATIIFKVYKERDPYIKLYKELNLGMNLAEVTSISNKEGWGMFGHKNNQGGSVILYRGDGVEKNIEISFSNDIFEPLKSDSVVSSVKLIENNKIILNK
ncbi:MAG: DUF559 domain-containing protein [Nanoarchaeota archaeon]|nr:DUF559 domain-containing protein [Nanoarchaeota archaeon]